MTDGLTPTTTDASPSRLRSRLRTFTGIAGIVSAVSAGMGVAAHFFGPVSTVVTLLASFTPLFVVLAVLSAVILAAARMWFAVLAAVAIVVVGVASQLPLFIGEQPTASGEAPTLRILQANLRLGEADPSALVDRVRGSGVDVLTVAELTGPAVDKLAAAGLREWLPYSYVRADYGGSGEGIYSRYPLTDTAALTGLEHHNLRATIQVPGAVPVTVYALHPLPPYPEPAWRWAAELDRIGAILAEERGPLIVGADFNSTYDHERYRHLLNVGARDGADLVDAGEYLGSGIVATYPADQWFPAVLGIDKILARGATPLSFVRVDLPGSDHHAVMGDVRLPPLTQP
ncbi:endonuclease/exonuclease/phosphatase family protein [Mycobacterium sp. 236(2023)]|uniref:endonuclease/exonuclease/phosphatase family protein n=1 Tax=Mycobacterium sp. 236(2023) TaxID=3038163 RepID=UPI002415745D|nr:endonuclease/exonuclease/phosphatase family protein [Mycobacterium sp. 236(2023)]MDG4668924.1 endonuclease/exonuclease/phosphatase family protein [Mycobacterium sp. 236(2023)]